MCIRDSNNVVFTAPDFSLIALRCHSCSNNTEGLYYTMKKLRTYDNDDNDDNDEQIKPCYCYFNSLPVLKKKKRFKN